MADAEWGLPISSYYIFQRNPNPDVSAALSPEEKREYEQRFVQSSLNFQTAWTVMLAVWALLFQLLRWLEVLPLSGAWLFAPLCLSLLARLVARIVARVRPWLTHPLALACVLLEVSLLISCHPSLAFREAIPWGTRAPEKPPVIDFKQQEDEMLRDLITKCDLQDRQVAAEDSHASVMWCSSQYGDLCPHQPTTTPDPSCTDYDAVFAAASKRLGMRVSSCSEGVCDHPIFGEEVQLLCPRHCGSCTSRDLDAEQGGAEPGQELTLMPDKAPYFEAERACLEKGQTLANSSIVVSQLASAVHVAVYVDLWVRDGDDDPSTGFDSISDGKLCLGCARAMERKRFVCMRLPQPETLADAKAHAQLSSTCVTKFIEEYDSAELQKNEYQEEYQAYIKATEEFKVQNSFDQMLIVYQLQIELWFMVTFVLLWRHTPATLLVCFSLYTSTTHNMDYLLEYVLLALSMAACLVAKFRLEHMQLDNFNMLLRTKQEASCQKDRYIQEKVKRCSAEFKTEQLTSVVEHLRVQGVEGVDELTTIMDDSSPPATKPTDVSARAARKVAASVRSAPAAMAEPFLDCVPRKVSGDCLPPDAFVWVEGQPLPIPASDVAAGRQVLCYDSLGRCPRFVEVTDARRLVGDVQWVVVSLEDGSSLTVTANHPMQPLRGQTAPAMHVPAANLQAGSDCLMVMKLVPVAVASVKHATAGLDKSRISLSLQQPQRHEVFVTQGQSGSRVAAGSANAGTDASLITRRTFIDVEPTAGARRRAASLPPRSAREGMEEDGTLPPMAAPPDPPGAPGARRNKRLTRSTSESDMSSIKSNLAPSFVTPSFVSTNSGLMCPSEMPSLSKNFQLGRLKSVGSAEHAGGACTPCLFHNRHIHEGAVPCRKGSSCERCHEYHDVLPKATKRKGSERRHAKTMRARTETVATPEDFASV